MEILLLLFYDIILNLILNLIKRFIFDNVNFAFFIYIIYIKFFINLYFFEIWPFNFNMD